MHDDRRSLLKALLAAIPAAAVSPHSFGQTPTGGIEVASGQDRFHKNRVVGVSSTTFKVAAPDTAGALFVIEQANAKHGGPPLHLHREQDEFWYVVEGNYMVEVGADRFRAGPGDCVLGPRNVAHTWAFVGDSPGRLLIAFTPAGKMQEWFERKAGQYVMDAAAYRDYGMELLGPPLSL